MTFTIAFEETISWFSFGFSLCIYFCSDQKISQIFSSCSSKPCIYRYRIGIRSASDQYQIGISRYEETLLLIYRIGRFWKWALSVFIVIGWYEKKVIGCTLIMTNFQSSFLIDLKWWQLTDHDLIMYTKQTHNFAFIEKYITYTYLGVS